MRGLGGISLIALLIACAGPALAGNVYDTPLRPSFAPDNGFTVGLIGGYGFGDAENSVGSTTFSFPVDGFDGGVLFGYDFETDGYFTAFELAGFLGGPSIDAGSSDSVGIQAHVDGRIRAGYRVAGGFSLSGIAGLSINNLADETSELDEWQFGWLVGVGADYMLTPKLSVGAEYTYNQLFNKTYADTLTVGGHYHAFRLATRLKI